MYLLIYVDDCLLLSPSKAEGEKEADKVLARFKGQMVPPLSVGSDFLELDFIGMEIRYSVVHRAVKFTAEKAIGRLR